VGRMALFFFKRLAFLYFLTELVRFGLIKREKIELPTVFFPNSCNITEKSYLRFRKKKFGKSPHAWGRLPILVGYFAPCISYGK
jgi:hypothetical protein